MTNIELLGNTNERMDKAVQHLNHELIGLRAGRANPQLLERVTVDYYGTPTPLNQVGNISAPEPRMLIVSPWDVTIIKEIEKGIQASDLGINPMNDGKIIRLVIPELTKERRQLLVKTIHKLGEEARVALRAIRHDANRHLVQMEKDNELTEDDLRRDEKSVQKYTDEHSKKIDQLIKDKEKEILEV
ncbi:MAG: ribosome recycling factor [Clostridiales bacterium]|nr:ribosome recycling factor [Clostridiales bacterium]